MSHSHAPPKKHGAGHHSQTPQVAVRDGNRLLCPCCGEVLMVLPELPSKQVPPQPSKPVPPKPTPAPLPDIEAMRKQAYDQLKAAFPSPPKRPRLKVDLSEADKGKPDPRTDHLVVPIDPVLANYEFPTTDPPKDSTANRSERPYEPKRKPLAPLLRLPHLKKRKKRKRPLRNAYSYRTARLYAWTYYRLKQLNVQLLGEVDAKRRELYALQQEFLGPAVATWVAKQQAEKEKTNTSCEQAPQADPADQHAQADLGVAPGLVLGTPLDLSSGQSLDAPPVASMGGLGGEATSPTNQTTQQTNEADETTQLTNQATPQTSDANVPIQQANERGPP